MFMEARNRFLGIDAASLCCRVQHIKGCRTGPPGLESISGLLNGSTNTGSGYGAKKRFLELRRNQVWNQDGIEISRMESNPWSRFLWDPFKLKNSGSDSMVNSSFNTLPSVSHTPIHFWLRSNIFTVKERSVWRSCKTRHYFLSHFYISHNGEDMFSLEA